MVDLTEDESFGFLGFDFRRVKTLRGKWGVRITPKMKARTALLRKLREVFRRFQSVLPLRQGLAREEDTATSDAGEAIRWLRLEKVE